MAWVGREVGGFSNQAMARQLGQDPSTISRGLSQLADELGAGGSFQGIVQQICDGLRKGRPIKRSITHA